MAGPPLPNVGLPGLTMSPDQTKIHVVLHVEPLPILTGSCARGAKVHGGFGLVVPRFTNAYQPSDLAPGRPHVAFTNLRLRQKE